ncbi:hypothetical protein SAMN02745166_01576 [Prosthecobacter debontii]|uniref:Uncharacterized protein n=1 Tax=Prosthecobacter debontii TaxID=48467 RepID=A0A1T4XIX0_9BACT|nr:hypothetical protein [Prosthecobacter debontii]SKA89363.1 hypothetical protein SAMN02745166_01576 [Prosthecobacter debontii]
MSATVETEQELTEEALAILRQHLPPHKVARLLSVWQIGKGDYTQDRDRLFTGDSVNSLFEEAAKYPSK